VVFRTTGSLQIHLQCTSLVNQQQQQQQRQRQRLNTLKLSDLDMSFAALGSLTSQDQSDANNRRAHGMMLANSVAFRVCII